MKDTDTLSPEELHPDLVALLHYIPRGQRWIIQREVHDRDNRHFFPNGKVRLTLVFWKCPADDQVMYCSQFEHHMAFNKPFCAAGRVDYKLDEARRLWESCIEKDWSVIKEEAKV